VPTHSEAKNGRVREGAGADRHDEKERATKEEWVFNDTTGPRAPAVKPGSVTLLKPTRVTAAACLGAGRQPRTFFI